jgi:hypothetical protein
LESKCPLSIKVNDAAWQKHFSIQSLLQSTLLIFFLTLCAGLSKAQIRLDTIQIFAIVIENFEHRKHRLSISV